MGSSMGEQTKSEFFSWVTIIFSNDSGDANFLYWTSEDQETPTLYLERSGLGSLPSPLKAAPPNAYELLPQISSLLCEHQKAIMCQLERQERALQQIKGRLDQQQSQAVSTC